MTENPLVSKLTLPDHIMRLLEDHDRCPPQASDWSRRRATATLIMQKISEFSQSPDNN